MKKSIKIAIFAAACIAVSPVILYAHDLTTNNKTQYYSTVQLLDGAKACAGTTGKITGPAPYTSSLSTAWWEVGMLCIGANPCKANIIVSKSVADIKQCKGDVIAETDMNLTNGTMTITPKANSENLKVTSPAAYTIDISP